MGDYEDFASEHKDSDSDQIEGKEEEEEGDIDDEYVADIVRAVLSG